jgi:hypothetical protein
MPRKPNYDFERKERERLKQQKNAARAEEKLKSAEQRQGENTPPPATPAPEEQE